MVEGDTGNVDPDAPHLTAAVGGRGELVEVLAGQLARAGDGKAEQELLDANTLIDALNQAVGEQPEDASAPTVTLGTGKQAQTYRFTVPQFHFAGYGVVVAAEVESNSDVLQALVKAGAKVLELVPAQ